MHSADFAATGPTPATPKECHWETWTDGRGKPHRREICEPGTPAQYPLSLYRGNVTGIRYYADAANKSGAVSVKRSFDIAGNLVTQSGPPVLEAALNYTTATQYAYPVTQTVGSMSKPGAQVATEAEYDLGTGMLLSSTDQGGLTTKYTYDPTTLRLQGMALPSGAMITRGYDDNAMTVTEISSSSASGKVQTKRLTRFNGLGQAYHEEDMSQAGIPNVIDTEFDSLGRILRQTRPFRPGQTPVWTEMTYDPLGRLQNVSYPDGGVLRYDNDVGGFAGQTVRLQDPWGRDRVLVYNGLGELTAVVTPNPDGKGSSLADDAIVTRFTYNGLGLLLSATQDYQQQRRLRYDSMGRLTHQALPERSITLDDQGRYSKANAKWTDVFVYDERSNLISHTDARGVKTLFNYGADPLNRLMDVTYDLSGVGDTSNPILPAPHVLYEYLTTGDVTKVSKITTSDGNTQKYFDNVRGQLNNISNTFGALPTAEFTVKLSV
jgi:YD repeat-containing protein